MAIKEGREGKREGIMSGGRKNRGVLREEGRDGSRKEEQKGILPLSPCAQGWHTVPPPITMPPPSVYMSFPSLSSLPPSPFLPCALSVPSSLPSFFHSPYSLFPNLRLTSSSLPAFPSLLAHLPLPSPLSLSLPSILVFSLPV